MPDLILFEPNFGGHRLDYCEWIIKWATGKGQTVSLAMSSEGLDSPEFHARPALVSLVFDKVDLGPLRDIDDPGYGKWLVATLREFRAAHPDAQLVVPEGDKFVPHVLSSRLRSDKRLTMLVLRMPSSAWIALRLGPKSLFKFALTRLLARTGVQVRALMPSTPVADCYRRGGVRATPDPVILVDAGERAICVAELDLDPSLTWFGVFGHIARRKNLDLVAKALTQIAADERVGLLVAGKIPEDEFERVKLPLEEFQAAGGELRLESRLLDAAELDAAIEAVDVTVLAHSSDGPSGILGKSVALGTRVVAAGARTLREELEANPSFGEWTSLDADSLASAFGACVKVVVHQGGQTVPLAGVDEFVTHLVGP